MKKLIYTIVTLMLLIQSGLTAENLHIEGSTTVGSIANSFVEVFKSLI